MGLEPFIFYQMRKQRKLLIHASTNRYPYGCQLVRELIQDILFTIRPPTKLVAVRKMCTLSVPIKLHLQSKLWAINYKTPLLVRSPQSEASDYHSAAFGFSRINLKENPASVIRLCIYLIYF